MPTFATQLEILAHRVRTNQLSPLEIEHEVMDCFKIVVEIERQGQLTPKK